MEPSQSIQRTSLMFTFTPLPTPPKPRPQETVEQHKKDKKEDTTINLRRRFTLPCKMFALSSLIKKATQEIIMSQLKKKKQIEAFKARQAEQRASQVVMFRQYRTGSLLYCSLADKKPVQESFLISRLSQKMFFNRCRNWLNEMVL